MKYVLYIQSVYGNATDSHLALRAAARERVDPLKRKWIGPWKIPTEILTAAGGLMVDREFLCRNHGYGEWHYTRGRCGYGDMSWYEVEVDVEDTSVTHDHLELAVDNKWSLWSDFGFDHGYGFVDPLIHEMPIGSSLDIRLACWKEIRYGNVAIKRSKAGYEVEGNMYTVWDDDSKTEHDFAWTRLSAKHVIKRINAEEDELLKADKWRSENEPMERDEEEVEE